MLFSSDMCVCLLPLNNSYSVFCIVVFFSLSPFTLFVHLLWIALRHLNKLNSKLSRESLNLRANIRTQEKKNPIAVDDESMCNILQNALTIYRCENVFLFRFVVFENLYLIHLNFIWHRQQHSQPYALLCRTLSLSFTYTHLNNGSSNSK